MTDSLLGCAVLVLHIVHVFVSSRKHSGLGLVAFGACSRRRSYYLAALVDELEVVTAEEMRYRGQLGAVPGRVVVQLEEGDGEEFHVLGDAEDLWW